MSNEQIEQEIIKLAGQLKQLRLPHKLNQYRVHEKKLLSLRTLAQNVTSDVGRQYEAQLDQLQSQLDSSVLCGSQCFLCGSGDSAALPAYNRSVSAGAVYQRAKPNTSRNGSALPKYGKQTSYHDKVVVNEVEAKVRPDIVPSMSPPPPPKEVKEEEKIAPDDGVKEQCENTSVVVEPAVNSKADKKNIELVDNQMAESNLPAKSYSPTREQSPSANGKATPPMSNANNNIEHGAKKPLASPSAARHKPIKPPLFSPAPFRSTPSSYRAYQDFIGQYSTDRNKENQVADNKGKTG